MCGTCTPLPLYVTIGNESSYCPTKWPKFKIVTKKLKLVKQLPKGERMVMRNIPTSTDGTPNLITSAWVINYGLFDENTHVLSPLVNTCVGASEPNIVTA